MTSDEAAEEARAVFDCLRAAGAGAFTAVGWLVDPDGEAIVYGIATNYLPTLTEMRTLTADEELREAAKAILADMQTTQVKTEHADGVLDHDPGGETEGAERAHTRLAKLGLPDAALAFVTPGMLMKAVGVSYVALPHDDNESDEDDQQEAPANAPTLH